MIPLMKHAFLHEHETKQALAEFILKSDRLTMGDECFNFERKFAAYQGSGDGVLFNSGGSANIALLQALKNLGRLRDGDRVGFSALTWSTNVFPIIQMGLVPVAIDCDPYTLNLMSNHLLERASQVEMKALFITNALGLTGDLDKIKDICDQKGIILLEDNCESLGTELVSGKAGNFGVGSTFSFFVAHHMSSIEGGMVCTRDQDLAEMLRMVRAIGWDKNLNAKQQSKWRRASSISSEFEARNVFFDLGFDMRPTEITGFLGQYQMQFLDATIESRQKNYFLIEKIIAENPELVLLKHDHISKLSTFAFPIVCKTAELRDRYISRFSGAGIELRPMIAGNIQRQPFYKKYVESNFDLVGADFLHGNGFYCGNYPELTAADLETISSCLFNY